MKFFKPEDFIPLTLEYTRQPNGKEELRAFRQNLVDLANAKLEREGKEVFSQSSDRRYWTDPGDPTTQGVHLESDLKAILIAIEPLERCSHPADKVTDSYGDKGFEGYECECGARVQVKSDGFEEVKEK